MKKILMAFTSLMLTACAATYQGRSPDFSLTGEAAQKEFSEFELHSDWWTDAPRYFAMGPDRALYTEKSLRPLMRSISPSAVEKELKAKRWTYLNWAIAATASVFLLSQRDEWESGDWALFGGAVLIGAGFGIYGRVLHGQAVEDYNRDLKQKFQGGLTYSIQY